MSEHTPTPILVSALKILANDIQSDDGVANACIFEGAERIEALRAQADMLAEALLKIRQIDLEDCEKYVRKADMIACEALAAYEQFKKEK